MPATSYRGTIQAVKDAVAERLQQYIGQPLGSLQGQKITAELLASRIRAVDLKVKPSKYMQVEQIKAEVDLTGRGLE